MRFLEQGFQSVLELYAIARDLVLTAHHGAPEPLLGVGHDTNTSLHLAEWRQPHAARGPQGGAVRLDDGTVEWLTWTDLLDQDNDFAQLGGDFEATGGARVGPVGSATARLMDQRTLVDFAVPWISARAGG